MPTEVSLGDYGRMIFETMTRPPTNSDHWESIRAEAEPLVRQLLALNEKMVGGGYYIVGLEKNGKAQRSRWDRIYDAQVKVLGVKPKDLKVGDYVWLLGEEFEHYPWQNDPVEVKAVGKMIVVEHPYDRHGIHQPGGRILKAPDDWEDNELYEKDEYWLKIADELGL